MPSSQKVFWIFFKIPFSNRLKVQYSSPIKKIRGACVVRLKPCQEPFSLQWLEALQMRSQNESTVSSLLLWENKGGKYVFFGLTTGFLTFQLPLRLPGIWPVRKRARESRAATHEIFLRVCSFRWIQKRIFDLRFARFRSRKEREIRNWICNLGNLSPMRAICTTASQKMTCFLLFDKLCNYTVQNLVVGSSNSDDGTYKTDQERSALKLKII